MKKIFLLFLLLPILSCSSDDDPQPCAEQPVIYYHQDYTISSAYKNNGIAIEFTQAISDEWISDWLIGQTMFDLPLNADGEFGDIYMSDGFSPHNPKFVVAFFKNGHLSCNELNANIQQLQTEDNVLVVRKLVEGLENKYLVKKEISVIELKLNDESLLVDLQSFASQNDLEVSETNPTTSESEELVYFLVDNSGKKSPIKVAKNLSESIDYEYIQPLFVSLGE